MTASAHPAPARHAVSLRALWFGIFGAPAAWGMQELVGVSLVSHACFPTLTPGHVRAGTGAWAPALIPSIVTVAIGAAALLVAYRAWRAAEPEHEDAEELQLEVGEDRARFMAFSGLLVAGVFMLALLMNFAVLFLVAPCG